jgi:hypothetical protein
MPVIPPYPVVGDVLYKPVTLNVTLNVTVNVTGPRP